MDRLSVTRVIMYALLKSPDIVQLSLVFNNGAEILRSEILPQYARLLASWMPMITSTGRGLWNWWFAYSITDRVVDLPKSTFRAGNVWCKPSNTKHFIFCVNLAPKDWRRIFTEYWTILSWCNPRTGLLTCFRRRFKLHALFSEIRCILDAGSIHMRQLLVFWPSEVGIQLSISVTTYGS